jgi:phage-related protein (TIGR01555 family)
MGDVDMTKKEAKTRNDARKDRQDLFDRAKKKVDSRDRSDGWYNILAGLGKRSDKAQRGIYREYTYLDDKELHNLWMGEGLAKKIVSVVADDMTRNWFSVSEDPDGKIQKELKRLNSETLVNEAIKWARLFRGSLIVMGANDGRDLEEPLAMKNVKTIDWLKVYPAPRIQILQTDIVTDPSSPWFEDVEIYPVQKLNGDYFKVHHSRCLVFRGDPVPHISSGTIDFQTLYWGSSILQAVWDRLRNYSQIEHSVANLMLEVIIGVYKLSGLAEILAEGDVDAVYNRLEIINASKSLINGVLLGENEDFLRNTANLTGIPETIDRFMMNLSAVAEIPVTRLFGRSPAGENATGEGDLRTYYDMVDSKQNTWLKPPLQYLVKIISGYVKGEAEPGIDFNPVWEPTQKETIEMRDKQSQTDERYINTGVLDTDEVRASRFEHGYSFDTSVEPREGGGEE